MLEGNTILAGLAAVTSRVTLGLLVGGVIYRNPALLAKTTTTLDIVSGGRAILGIGAAWNEEESDAYDIPFPPLKERFERLEDALNIARLLFTQPEATYEGRHHSVHGALNNPKPLRGDIPIMIGGSGERKTLRFVAQYADACNVFGDVERVKHLLGVLERHCEDVGRDPAEITKTRNGVFLVARTREELDRKRQALFDAGYSQERLQPSLALVGTPEELAEQAQGFKDAGLDGLTGSLPDVHDLEAVRMVGEAIGPVFA
jgi:alkanesulfonate monooxygenase SsuD/methylene tetrahydromethanopterin reductase-like flavin-dependent oxidoreductase (luciferase family)